MDGFASIIIFLIFLAVTFSRKSKLVKTQTPNKPIIPVRKKEPWAADAFVTSSKTQNSMIPEKLPDEPIMSVDRIASEDNFWSANETESYFNDHAFYSMENEDLPDESTNGKSSRALVKSEELNEIKQIESLFFIPTTSKSLVAAVILKEILDRPFNHI